MIYYLKYGFSIRWYSYAIVAACHQLATRVNVALLPDSRLYKFHGSLDSYFFSTIWYTVCFIPIAAALREIHHGVRVEGCFFVGVLPHVRRP